MRTGGYDVVAEVHERFVNRALSAAFYTTLIPKIEGSYAPPDVPPSFRTYARIDYKVKLKDPPMVDVFTGNMIRLLFNMEAAIKVLGGLRLEFDVIASVETSPVYNQTTRVLVLDLKRARIDEVRINDKYGIPAEALRYLNQAISSALTSGMLDTMEKIEIAPVLASLDLPYMPAGPSNKLTVRMGNVKLFNARVIAVAVDLLNYTGGNVNQVTDFSDNLDMAVGVSEAAMHRVFDFWWDRTTFSKSVTSTGSSDIPAVQTLLDTVADIFDLATTIASLGFLETDYEVERAWVEYGATVGFGKPTFNLLAGNKLEITNCPLHIHAWATPKLKVNAKVEIDTSGVIPDSWTPWEDDVTIANKTTTVTIFNFSTELDVNLDHADAEVYLDGQNRLMAKVTDVDITIHLPWSLPEAVLNSIIDWIEGLIKDKIPVIPLSPAVFTDKIPGTQLNLEVDIDKLVTYEDEAIVGASVRFKDIPTSIIPVPKFVANRDTLSMEVHRAGCQWVDEIFEKNKVGYYSLYDALKGGYDGCKYCLPEYHTR